jgi:glycosyltransferase involved in cell wall biosynthesis
LRKNDEISKDAFPVKIWEYLGLGIPSIVTPRCEAGDFLEANECGFQLESGHTRELVDKILELKEDSAKLARLEKNCRGIRTSYTREKLGTDAAKFILDSVARDGST